MVDELANLQIAKDEDDLVCDQEYGEEIDDEFKLCLVGKVLTNSAVHFSSMRTVLRKLWHPLEGVLITKMEDKIVLFQFYNKLDLKRVTDGTPWFFNRYLIIFHRMERGEDPVQVLLVFSNFWVQVRNLPLGSMSERMTRQLENFMGHFLEYDATIITRGVKNFMRIRVCLDNESRWLRKEPKTMAKSEVGVEVRRKNKFMETTMNDQSHNTRRREIIIQSKGKEVLEGCNRDMKGVDIEMRTNDNKYEEEPDILEDAQISSMVTVPENRLSVAANKKKQKLMKETWRGFGKKCGFDNGIDISAEGSQGGLFLGWKQGISINLISFSKSHIDVEVGYDNDMTESIWGAWDLLESEVGWRIGDRKTVNIWNNTWLPYFGNKKLPHRLRDCTSSGVDSGEFEVGNQFTNNDSFIGALKQHSIKNGVNNHVVKSKSDKFEVKCAVQAGTCSWKIYASLRKMTGL
ncbi:hypothetical protein Godav_002747 [Gossypium davidsonii]|uniref:DUF4283 domain-containing protein n=1 Tax=Gossypium davidsonii TaxID=34287 RepID=A0A7J8SYU0_GOSDV|nr:hypothetical protein [Gossypium davidsonii]